MFIIGNISTVPSRFFFNLSNYELHDNHDIFRGEYNDFNCNNGPFDEDELI